MRRWLWFLGWLWLCLAPDEVYGSAALHIRAASTDSSLPYLQQNLRDRGYKLLPQSSNHTLILDLRSPGKLWLKSPQRKAMYRLSRRLSPRNRARMIVSFLEVFLIEMQTMSLKTKPPEPRRQPTRTVIRQKLKNRNRRRSKVRRRNLRLRSRTKPRPHSHANRLRHSLRQIAPPRPRRVQPELPKRRVFGPLPPLPASFYKEQRERLRRMFRLPQKPPEQHIHIELGLVGAARLSFDNSVAVGGRFLLGVLLPNWLLRMELSLQAFNLQQPKTLHPLVRGHLWNGIRLPLRTGAFRWEIHILTGVELSPKVFRQSDRIRTAFNMGLAYGVHFQWRIHSKAWVLVRYSHTWMILPHETQPQDSQTYQDFWNQSFLLGLLFRL